MLAMHRNQWQVSVYWRNHAAQLWCLLFSCWRLFRCRVWGNHWRYRPVEQQWPIVSACHAGLLADNRTPVGSALAIVQFTINGKLHYFYVIAAQTNQISITRKKHYSFVLTSYHMPSKSLESALRLTRQRRCSREIRGWLSQKILSLLLKHSKCINRQSDERKDINHYQHRLPVTE